MRTFLHVGCGGKRKAQTVVAFQEGWEEVSLDIDASVGPDIVDKLPELAKVADRAYDAVYSSHNIEHLYPHEVEIALRSFRRVLRPGGVAVLTCPDLQSIGQRIAEGRIEEPLYVSPAGPVAPLDVLYGFRPALRRGNLYMAHHGGFTLQSLGGACRRAGFASVVGRRRPERFDLWVLAAAEQRPEAELKALAATMLQPVPPPAAPARMPGR